MKKYFIFTISFCFVLTIANTQITKDTTKKISTKVMPHFFSGSYAPKILDEVQVVAIRGNDKSPFAKFNIQNLNKAFINLGQDIPFLFNQTPSVIINSDAGNGIGYTGLRIRGTDATRINMTINGIPYNDAESQGLFFVNLPDFASSVSSVQLQRGVGSSSNGAGAFGASMSFSTNELIEKPTILLKLVSI
jgi:iron complex outermembrane receptor protein